MPPAAFVSAPVGAPTLAPVDGDLYELTPEEALGSEKVPASPDAVLDDLETDHGYLIDVGGSRPTWSRRGASTSGKTDGPDPSPALSLAGDRWTGQCLASSSWWPG